MKMRTLLLVVLALFLVDMVYAQGCSQCKLVAEQASQGVSDVDESSFGGNINMGILYLMAVPYLLLMFLFRKQLKRAFQFIFRKKTA